MNNFEKLLHFIDIKINRSTSYTANKKFGIKNLLNHTYRHFIYPFQKRGWFGYCDECGKFKFNLVKNLIDTDVDVDEEGHGYTIPIYGMVCDLCDATLEAKVEEGYGY